MKSLVLLPTLALSVLLAQIILSRLSDSILALSDSAHTLSLLITLCPPIILARFHSSLPHHARLRLPTLFSLLAPLLLSSLSFSLALGSFGRLVRPHAPHRPVIIIIGGVLGLVFNILYIIFAGTLPKCPSRKGSSTDQPPTAGAHDGDPGLSLARPLPLWHILASLTPSTLLIASGLALHLMIDSVVLRYMDPTLCLSNVVIMVASAYSSIVQNGRLLLQAVPPYCDLPSLKRGLESLCGPEGHHELHVWEVAPDQAVASLHLCCPGPESYQVLLEQTRLLLGRHGIGKVTVQPEFANPGACSMACGPACVHHLCCDPRQLETSKIKGQVLHNKGETGQFGCTDCVHQLNNQC
ncbi:zinc transporter 10-like [Bombina bombina]|uniref:zinc transporter 10-like n=1 Tax=Bombina bombina TaxID=8345 RepID=UPI00235A9D65|nr:zinc transporter 10-like [Bombina bombina]